MDMGVIGVYSPGFVNTNTGFFGLGIRRALRRDLDLRRWIKYTTLRLQSIGGLRPLN